MSPREAARNLDGWAASEARKEMITTMERQRHEAELVALWNSHTVSARMRETSPPSQNWDTSSSSSLEIPSLGASTLVQRWRDFEADAKLLDHSNSFNSNSVLVEPKVCCDERDDEEVEEPSSSSSREDLYPEEDWEESNRAAVPTSCERPSPDSDSGGESERIRVADIIRRLTTTTTLTPRSSPSLSSSSRDENGHPPSINDASSMSRERFSPSHILVNSPRRLIKGRQAFNDVLVQMERDRQRELQSLADRRPVSSFPQRGRIQSLLRLRFLHREPPVVHQEHRSPLHSTPSWSQLRQRSNVTLLRERFSTGAMHGGVMTSSGEANVRSPPREIVNTILDSEDPSTAGQLCEDVHQESVSAAEQQISPQVELSGTCAPEEIHEDSSPISDVTQQETSSNFSSVDSLECSGTPTYLNNLEENVSAEDANNQQHMETTYYDWFSEIARPQRDWEDRRQERYQEMLDTSNNGDISQLLERRRVSSFLASDLRERIDQLLVSFLERQTDRVGSQEEGERGAGEVEEGLGEVGGEEDEGEGYFEAEQVEMEEEVEEEEEVVAVHEEQEQDEVNFNYEEEETPMGHRYYDLSAHYDQTSSSIQMPLPSLLRQPWNQSYNHGGGGGSDQVLSTFFPPPCQFYSHESRQCSCKNHPSIEMNLIYDLRRHMEELHYEMSDLQKSMKRCMKMQVQLHHSIEQKVSSAEHNSVGGEGKRSSYRAPNKGNCCICYETQVDSLLYRCGHMCTCLKCAQELQCSSKKCPVCRAPIVDVVRA